MSEHTKGEWLVDGMTVYALQDCVWMGQPSKENRFYIGVQGKCPDNEKIANANLIAAAPDMYDALINIKQLSGEAMDYGNNDSIMQKCYIKSTIALAKARGEE